MKQQFPLTFKLRNYFQIKKYMRLFFKIGNYVFSVTHSVNGGGGTVNGIERQVWTERRSPNICCFSRKPKNSVYLLARIIKYSFYSFWQLRILRMTSLYKIQMEIIPT